MQLGGSAPSQYGEVAHDNEVDQDEPPTKKLVRDQADLQSQAEAFLQQAAQGIPAPHWPKDWGGNTRLTQESFRQSLAEMLQDGEITEANAFLRVQTARSLGWCV